MAFRIGILSLIVAGLLYSCKPDKDLYFDENDFAITTIDLNYDNLLPDSVILGSVNKIKLFCDSIIVLRDTQSRNQIHLYNLNSGMSREFISIGNGPEEVLFVDDILISGDTLIFSSCRDRKILKFKVDTETLEPTLVESLSLPYTASPVAYRKGSNTLISVPMTIEPIRFIMSDLESGQADSIFQFPIRRENGEPSNIAFNTHIRVSEDNKKLLLISHETNILELYDFESGKEKLLKVMVDVDFEVKRRQNGNVIMEGVQPRWHVFLSDIASFDDKFIIGYTGKPFDSENQSFINSLLVIDTEGNPVKKINLSNDILTFDYDHKNGKLYYITMQPETELNMIDLKL